MLEGLDVVDWADLTHAYGRAGDVPDQIRGLRSPDSDVRSKALNSLYGNVFHQGTRYEASAHAVPFLLELLADPGTPDRAAVLGLLTHLAVGYAEGHLPSGYPVADHRAQAARGDVLLAKGKGFVDEEAGETEEDWDEEDGDDEPSLFQYMGTLDDADNGRLDAYLALAAYDAVRSGLPLFRELLTDDEVPVRIAAAYALAWYPEEAEAVLPALVRAAADPEPAVAATVLVAIGLLGAASGAARMPEVTATLDAALDDPRDVVRWGAAIGQARLRGPAADGRVADELLGWVGYAGRAHETIPFLDGDLRGYAAQALHELGDVYADALFAELLARLPSVSGTEALLVADAALPIAFPEPLPAGTTFTALDERQRRIVRVLADSPDTWRFGSHPFGNFSTLVMDYGLPRSAREMAEYASELLSGSPGAQA